MCNVSFSFSGSKRHTFSCDKPFWRAAWHMCNTLHACTSLFTVQGSHTSLQQERGQGSHTSLQPGFTDVTAAQERGQGSQTSLQQEGQGGSLEGPGLTDVAATRSVAAAREGRGQPGVKSHRLDGTWVRWCNNNAYIIAMATMHTS